VRVPRFEISREISLQTGKRQHRAESAAKAEHQCWSESGQRL
jgi:hypothetical protein